MTPAQRQALTRVASGDLGADLGAAAKPSRLRGEGSAGEAGKAVQVQLPGLKAKRSFNSSSPANIYIIL